MVIVMRWIRSKIAESKSLGPAVACCSLPVLIVFVLAYLVTTLPVFIIGRFVNVIQQVFFPCIVEHLYMWGWVGRIHITIMKWISRSWLAEVQHSRGASEFRVEIIPGKRWVHMIPMFQDNYSYLIVDRIPSTTISADAKSSDVVIKVSDLGSCTDMSINDNSSAPEGNVAESNTTHNSSPPIYGKAKNEAMYIGVLVDPSEADAVEGVLDHISIQHYGGTLELAALFTTHKHWDHQGGNSWFRKHFPNLPIYAAEPVIGLNTPLLKHLQVVKVSEKSDMEFLTIKTPAHTRGHIMFLLLDPTYTFDENINCEKISPTTGNSLGKNKTISTTSAPSVTSKPTKIATTTIKIETSTMKADGKLAAEPRSEGNHRATPVHAIENAASPMKNRALSDSKKTHEPDGTSKKTQGQSVSSSDRAETGFKPPKHCLFTGDTLFCGGHGALFEGTQTEMLRNFSLVLAHCSRDTLLFTGHEYTSFLLLNQLSSEDSPCGGWHHWNLNDFARLAFYTHQAHHRRNMEKFRERIPTMPLHLAEEVGLNPYFRVVQERRYNLINLFKSKASKKSNISVSTTVTAGQSNSAQVAAISANRSATDVVQDNKNAATTAQKKLQGSQEYTSSSSACITDLRTNDNFRVDVTSKDTKSSSECNIDDAIQCQYNASQCNVMEGEHNVGRACHAMQGEHRMSLKSHVMEGEHKMSPKLLNPRDEPMSIELLDDASPKASESGLNGALDFLNCNIPEKYHRADTHQKADAKPTRGLPENEPPRVYYQATHESIERACKVRVFPEREWEVLKKRILDGEQITAAELSEFEDFGSKPVTFGEEMDVPSFADVEQGLQILGQEIQQETRFVRDPAKVMVPKERLLALAPNDANLIKAIEEFYGTKDSQRMDELFQMLTGEPFRPAPVYRRIIHRVKRIFRRWCRFRRRRRDVSNRPPGTPGEPQSAGESESEEEEEGEVASDKKSDLSDYSELAQPHEHLIENCPCCRVWQPEEYEEGCTIPNSPPKIHVSGSYFCGLFGKKKQPRFKPYHGIVRERFRDKSKRL